MDVTDNNKIKTQVEAVRYFFQKLDSDMINLILNENNTYQDFPKSVFIEKLKLVFEKFIQSEDTFLDFYQGKCKECYKGLEGCLFVGNKSKNYIPIIFLLEAGQIKDMFECSDFHHFEKNIELKERFYIRKFDFSNISNRKNNPDDHEDDESNSDSD